MNPYIFLTNEPSAFTWLILAIARNGTNEMGYDFH